MTRLGQLGEAVAWLISLLAWWLSYQTQVELAQSTAAFPAAAAWVWPATVDAASLVAMVLALDSARQGRSARAAWAIAGLAAGVMMVANVVGSWPHPIAMGLHAWPPAIALACWWLLTHERRKQGMRADTGAERLEVRASRVSQPTPVQPRVRPHPLSKVPREPAFALMAERGVLPERELAEVLSVSRATAGRLRREYLARSNGYG